MTKNSHVQLANARTKKNNEFYTRFEDVQACFSDPIIREGLKDKIIFMPCNDANPDCSVFWDYFKDNFSALGLKAIVATEYCPQASAFTAKEFRGHNEESPTPNTNHRTLLGDGDFESAVIQDLLNTYKQEGEVVIITNPPFSKTKAFIEWVVKQDCDYCILGAIIWAATSYFLPFLRSKRTPNFGRSVYYFIKDDGELSKSTPCKFYTSFKVKLKQLPQKQLFNPEFYSLVTEYKPTERSRWRDAFPNGIDPQKRPVRRVDKIVDIPTNYAGILFVPSTILGYNFLNYYNLLGFGADFFIGDREVFPGYFIQMKPEYIVKLLESGVEIFYT